ncbi:MAG TPA: serine hydrolase [Opitutaceae bacterium]|nr:serine hydrolase [Opitutaceae bacterium]
MPVLAAKAKGMKTLRAFAWWLWFGCLATALLAARPEGLADFDAFVARVRQEFNVPGIAVAVVKDGEVVLEQGYGLRKLGETGAVDAHTRFAIASNTKAFTAALLALLVDEGKLKWGDRVVDHLPWFQMADPYVTREMTVRDLLVHRSGLALGAGDLLFWPATTFTSEEVVQRLRYVPLETSFRSAYAYDNILYGVAGLIIEKIAGKRWGEVVRERIFAPLEMTETSAAPIVPTTTNNAATGHALYDFKDLRPVEQLAWDNNPAAGAIHSSVHDMAKWMRVQLASGAMGSGGRLFKAERQNEMWSVVTPMPINVSSMPALAAIKPNFLGYGLGWVLTDFRGRKLVTHNGGWPGMVSRLTLVPELKLGVMVMTNQEVGAAFNAITWRVLDSYTGAAPTDWVAVYSEVVKKSQSNADEGWAKHVAARDPAAKMSLPAQAYAGTYRDAWYGDIALVEEAGKLMLRFSRTEQLVGDVEHWQHQTFIVRWKDRSLNADAWLTFALTPDGQVERAKLAAISPLTDFSFDFHHLDLKRVR